MAGIFITSSIGRGKGFSMSGYAFNGIVERTRKHFRENEQLYLQKIYEPLDEGCQDIISLEEQNTEGFNAFYNATESAMKQYKEGKNMSEEDLLKEDIIYDSWKGVLEFLRKDDRFN